MNTKILMSVLVIGLAAMAVGTAMTGAYFSDTETSDDNTFTAGTLDLELDGVNTNVVKFNVNNAVPGDSACGTWKVKNVGDTTGYLDLESIVVTDSAGTTPEPEPTTDSGELSSNMNVVIFVDNGAGTNGNANNCIKDGTEVQIYNGALSGIAGNYGENLELSGSSSSYVSMSWEIPTTVANSIMDDSVDLDMTFELAQTQTQ